LLINVCTKQEPTSTPAPVRSSWTNAEDRQLCRSWISASNNPAHSSGIKGQDFWETVEKFYYETDNKTTASTLPIRLILPIRNISSMMSRWSDVHKNVSKFSDYVRQAE
jgi:hypothetical protein